MTLAAVAGGGQQDHRARFNQLIDLGQRQVLSSTSLEPPALNICVKSIERHPFPSVVVSVEAQIPAAYLGKIWRLRGLTCR